MARPKKEDKDEEVVDSVKMAAKAFFKNNKEYIYNDPDEPYVVSTGVYQIDQHLGGGIQSGTLARFIGPPSSGKSSEALLVVKNFIDNRADAGRKARGIFIPTEARLTEKLKSRSGVIFVEDPEKWENGTVLILPTNNYDKIANFLLSLVKTNAMKKKTDRENIICVVDSMDYLTLESDLNKEFGEARRPAGSQYLTKILWSVLALPWAVGQHLFISISQQSAAPKIDKYAKDPMRQGGSSGGSGIQYQSSAVISFRGRYQGDYLLEDQSANYDPKTNKKIGHVVAGDILKSDNEAYDVKFDYKVKYGRTGANSVWIESDIFDWLVSWEILYKESGKGSWFTLETNMRNSLLGFDPEIPEKFQGQDKFMTYLESQPKVTQELYKKMTSLYDTSKTDYSNITLPDEEELVTPI